ncbi:MAG: recombinase RecT [Bacilli bacterium]|jgi:recombination protein RecT|nr:recombinase RecT [Bacilli bacterium]
METNSKQVPAKVSLKQEIATAIVDKNISDSVLGSINKLITEGQLKFPDGYPVGNECKLAYLSIIQNQQLAGVTPASIGTAIVDTLVQGLKVEQKQCYYIKYGNKCQMFRSYFGDIAVAYGTKLVSDIKAVVVRQDDDFETDVVDDEEVVVRHHSSFANHDKPIIAAYAEALMANGKKRYCVMSKKEIDQSWLKTKSTGGTQREFPQEMAKRTVIRRLVKMIFNTANTKDNFIGTIVESYNRTTDDEYDNGTKASGVSNDIVPDDDGVIDETDSPEEEPDSEDDDKAPENQESKDAPVAK